MADVGGGGLGLDVRGLSAGYGSVEVLHEVSFEAVGGSVVAVVGLNGAGKSTMLRTIAGIKRPTAGRVLIGGLDPHTRAGSRVDVALVLQGVVIDRQLKAREYLQFAARARGLPRKRANAIVDEVVDELGLADLMDRRGDQMSGGQARRVQLAGSLVRKPRLLLLDEPTGGLDPSARRRYWPLIRGLADRDVTVVVVTHYIDEAGLADKVVVLADGAIVSQGSPDRLTSAAGLSVVRIDCVLPETADAVHEALRPLGAERSDVVVTVTTDDPARAMAVVGETGTADNVDLHVRPAELDDVLIRLATTEGVT